MLRVMVRGSRGFTLTVLALSLGCSGRGEVCEKAKAAYDRSGRTQVERVAELAPPQEAEAMQADAEALHQESLRRFDKACLTTDETTYACLQKLEDLVEAEATMRAELKACGGDEGQPEAECVGQAQAKLQEAFGGCQQPLHAFGQVLAAG